MAVAVERRRAAAPAPGPAPAPAPAPVGARRVRPIRRPKLGRFVMWIAVMAVLLAGIVALNVAVLQLRVERGSVASEIARIRAENAQLAAELSSAAAIGRTQARGQQLGLVEPTVTTYVKLRVKRPHPQR